MRRGSARLFVAVLLGFAAALCFGNPGSLLFGLNPTIGGNNIPGKVTLTAPAGAGGEVVALTSNVPIPDLPATITVPAGATTKAFSFTPNGVDAAQSFSVQASSNGVTVSSTLTVKPAGLHAFAYSPGVVVGGNNTSGVVTLNGAAGPTGTVVSLTSSSSKVQMPTTIIVPAQA
ncbi:MAG: hypothetical protein ABUL72_06535, partial [Armatimonadota bacterium]